MKHKQQLVNKIPNKPPLPDPIRLELQAVADRLTQSTPGLHIRVVDMPNLKYVIVTDGSLSEPLHAEIARYTISALVVGWKLHETMMRSVNE